MPRHTFNFDGGVKLTTLGASWFVSYLYYTTIDSSHLNWRTLSTAQKRISAFQSTTDYHTYWLEQIINMHDNRLTKNQIGLSAEQTKAMARSLLAGTCGRRSFCNKD
jgi:hypothetical protein